MYGAPFTHYCSLAKDYWKWWRLMLIQLLILSQLIWWIIWSLLLAGLLQWTSGCGYYISGCGYYQYCYCRPTNVVVYNYTALPGNSCTWTEVCECVIVTVIVCYCDHHLYTLHVTWPAKINYVNMNYTKLYFLLLSLILNVVSLFCKLHKPMTFCISHKHFVINSC